MVIYQAPAIKKALLVGAGIGGTYTLITGFSDRQEAEVPRDDLKLSVDDTVSYEQTTFPATSCLERPRQCQGWPFFAGRSGRGDDICAGHRSLNRCSSELCAKGLVEAVRGRSQPWAGNPERSQHGSSRGIPGEPRLN